jgi:hypothetical protein
MTSKASEPIRRKLLTKSPGYRKRQEQLINSLRPLDDDASTDTIDDAFRLKQVLMFRQRGEFVIGFVTTQGTIDVILEASLVKKMCSKLVQAVESSGNASMKLPVRVF